MPDLAPSQEPTSILRPGGSSFADYAPISRHTGEMVALPRTPDWLATISAGKRAESKDGRPGLPQMSRDGRIELHDPDGRAPGLAAALEASEHKRLLIAFVSNNPADVIQERIVGYSATQLRFHGDSESITELMPVRNVHLKGTPGYAAALAQSTVSRRVFFALARWDDDGTPRVYFPDGLGVYSIRTTSARSTANIAATLDLIGRQTGGVIVGLPFELSLSARQVADPTGALRTVRLWSMVFSPPKTMQLTSGTFRMLAEKSLEQGRALMLPAAPRPESIEDAAYEGSFTVEDAPTVSEPSETELGIMHRGTPVDKCGARKRWFATVKNSPFAGDLGRAAFIEAWSDDRTDSLSELMDLITREEIYTMFDALDRCIADDGRLPTAWEGLNQQIDQDTGEISDGPSEDPDEAQILLGAVERSFKAAKTRDMVKAARAMYADAWDLLTGVQQALIKGWEREAINRVLAAEEEANAAFEVMERERRERAEANRATIDATRSPA